MRRKPTRQVPVQCVETGKIWESVKKCAKYLKVSTCVLQERIKFNEDIRGRHYTKDIKNYFNEII